MGNGISSDEPGGPAAEAAAAPPALERPEQPREAVEANAANLWQRMLEHAIEAAADGSDAVASPVAVEDDSSVAASSCGLRPPVVALLARTPTSLVLGVDADDLVWRRAAAAARGGTATYDLEICEATAEAPEWRTVALAAADRSHVVEDLRPNAGYRARARRREPPSAWGPLSQVLRCTGRVPSWFEAWRYKKTRRADSKTEVLAFGAASNRLGADIPADLLRRIHGFLSP